MQYWLDGRNGRFLSPRVSVRPGTETTQPGGIVEGVDDPEAVEYELRVSVIVSRILATDINSIFVVNHCRCEREINTPSCHCQGCVSQHKNSITTIDP